MPLKFLRLFFWMMLKLLRLLSRHSEGFNLRNRRIRARLRERIAPRTMVDQDTQTPPEMEPKRNSKQKKGNELTSTGADQAGITFLDRTVASSSTTAAIATHTVANTQVTQSLERAIPPELWSIVSEFLTSNDLRSLRLSCSHFRNAAHQTWARTLDKRTFALTCTELDWLKDILEKTKAGPHVKTLRIDAQVACQCQKAEYWEWVMRNIHSRDASGRKEFKGFGDRKYSACMSLLWELAELVPNLTSIEMRATQRTKKSALQSIGGLQPDSSVGDRYLSVQRWSSWRAMDTLVSAFKEHRTLDGETKSVPSPQTMIVSAPMPFEALPGHLSAFCSTRVFSNLTKLSLSLARAHLDWYSAGYGRIDKCLPEFLALLPRTLRELTLDFPKDRNHLIRLGQAGSIHFEPLFGDHGWTALNDRGPVTFPTLHALHLSHLSLSAASILQAFLRRHSSALHSLHLTSLALVSEDWKPFLQFLGATMALDKLVMDSDLNAQEAEAERRIWLMAPVHHHPSGEDWRRAAKESWMNGRKWEEEKRAVVEEEEEGADEQGAEGEEQPSHEQQMAAEENGYEGDAEEENVLAA